MADVEIELDSAGIQALLKSSEMQGVLNSLLTDAISYAAKLGLEAKRERTVLYTAATRSVLSVPVKPGEATSEKLNVATNLAVQRHNRRSS